MPDACVSGRQIPIEPNRKICVFLQTNGVPYGPPKRLFRVALFPPYHLQDVGVLAEKLPNVAEDKVMPFAEFNHLDFLWANNIRDIVYEDLVGFMKRYDRKYADQGPVRLPPEVDANVVHPDYVEPNDGP